MTLTTSSGWIPNLWTLSLTFHSEVFSLFQVPKWTKFLLACKWVVFSSCGWLVEKLLGWIKLVVILGKYCLGLGVINWGYRAIPLQGVSWHTVGPIPFWRFLCWRSYAHFSFFSLDQHPNSNQIVGNWKIGKRMKKEIGTWENLLIWEQIAECVGRFMDLESNEGKEMRRVARQFRDSCGGATAEGR